MVTLAFVISNTHIKWDKIILSGIILALISYTVRFFSIPFGVHTILLIISLFVILIWLGKGEFSLSLVASLLSYLALAVVEFVCLSLLMPVFGVTPETLFADSFKRIIMGQPIVLLLFITAFILHKFYTKRGKIHEFF